MSVAFYCVGFGEGVESLIGGSDLVVRVSAALAAVGLLALTYAGANLATRFQFVIMFILGGALISFFAGAQVGFSLPVLKQGWEAAEDGPPFCTIFAILFSAVTGFTQGVSMSGDLKNPAKSLPAGTFLAVGLSTVVYVVTVFTLAGTLSSTELSSDYDSVKRVAMVPRLVDLGVLSATLSSALASFLGAAGSHKPSRATACLSR